MLRLNLKKEPYELPLLDGKVVFKVKPATTSLISSARHLAAKKIEENVEDWSFVFLVEVAKMAIIEWVGIGEKDRIADITPENIEAVLEIYPLAQEFEKKYLDDIYVLDDEKNA